MYSSESTQEEIKPSITLVNDFSATLVIRAVLRYVIYARYRYMNKQQIVESATNCFCNHYNEN